MNQKIARSIRATVANIMNRRSFLSNIARSVAFVAMAKVGLGNTMLEAESYAPVSEVVTNVPKGLIYLIENSGYVFNGIESGNTPMLSSQVRFVEAKDD